MKKNNSYLSLLGLLLLLLQGSSTSAGSRRQSIWRKSDPIQVVDAAAVKWQINDDVHKDLLFAATQKNSDMILSFESNPQLWARPYPSQVIRAAKDVALQVQGEKSKVYQVLQRMLSYK